jgi:hypothetical protein
LGESTRKSEREENQGGDAGNAVGGMVVRTGTWEVGRKDVVLIGGEKVVDGSQGNAHLAQAPQRENNQDVSCAVD